MKLLLPVLLTLAFSAHAYAQISGEQQFKVFGQGDIQSANTRIKSIPKCAPVNKYGNLGTWQKINGKLVCTSPSKDKSYPQYFCSASYVLEYTVSINNKFQVSVRIDTDHMNGANELNIPVNTVFDESTCRDYLRKTDFAGFSAQWLSNLNDVQRGKVSYDDRDKKCRKNTFRATYEANSFDITNYRFATELVACP